MVLINGKGGGLTGDKAFCNDTLSVINVEPGKDYRFRLIGGTAFSFNTLGIEDHDNLEVIEADAYVTISFSILTTFSLIPKRAFEDRSLHIVLLFQRY